MLYEALPPGTDGADLERAARETVERFRTERRIIPGSVTRSTSRSTRARRGCSRSRRRTASRGDYVELMQLIGAEAERVYERPLPVNATGAIGAICCELGFPWEIVRGFGVMARAIGLVGHILEEREQPLAIELWQRTEDEATAHLRGEQA